MRHQEVDCWTDAPLEHFIAFLIFVMAVAVLFPWGLNYSTTVRNLSEGDVIPTDVALNEIRQLLVRIDEPGFTPAVAHQVIKRAAYIERHSPWVPAPEKTKVADDYSQLRALEVKHSRIYRAWSQIAQSARDKFRGDRIASDELFKLEKNDAELQALFDFRPTTTTYHWDVIGENFRIKLPFSFVFALMFFVAMIKARRLNLAVELMNPLFLILATATFPVSWLVYPYKDPDQQISKVINAIGMAFSLLISFSGVATAQTKKSEGGKKKAEHQLQIDLRNSSYIGDGPPDPNFQVRVSFYEEKWMLETVNGATPREGKFYSEVGGGAFLKRTPKTWLLAVGYSSQNQKNERSVIAGGEFFRFGPRVTWAFPVIRYEHGIAGPPSRTFAFVANPLFRFKAGSRFGIAPDVSLRKLLGKPLVWNAGAGIKWSLGKAKRQSVEVGGFRDSRGFWSLRARSTLNFAF